MTERDERSGGQYLSSVIDFGAFFGTKDPMSALVDACRKVPGKVENEEINKLWQENRVEELMCLCLPTLSACLGNYHLYGVNKKELLETGLCILPGLIKDWTPEKRGKNGKTDYLKTYVSRNLRVTMQEKIVRWFGLAGRDNFALVQLYSRSWGSFVSEHNGQQPELSEITEIVEEENNGKLKLTIDGNGEKISKIEIMYMATQPESEEKGWFVAEENLVRDTERDLENLPEILQKLIQTLEPGEQKVLNLRFGLKTEGERSTLGEVAVRLGLTTERVRQIEAKALRKLRHPSKSQQLRNYLD